MPTMAVKIIGAIQGTLGGPKLVHAKPKRPADKQGITVVPLASDTMKMFRWER